MEKCYSNSSKSHSRNFDFPSLRQSSPVSFLRAPTRTDIIEFENFLLQLKNLGLGEKSCEAFFYLRFFFEIFHFKYNCTLLFHVKRRY